MFRSAGSRQLDATHYYYHSAVMILVLGTETQRNTSRMRLSHVEHELFVAMRHARARNRARCRVEAGRLLLISEKMGEKGKDERSGPS